MRLSLKILTAAFMMCALPAFSAASEGDDQPPPSGPSSGVTVTIYPLLARAPIFGATVDLPALPSLPPGAPGGDESGAVSGSTDTSLNGAYMAGVLVESPRWFGEFYGLWAALSASRSSPRVGVDNDTYFVNARAGVRLFKGLAATGGFRAVHTSLDATLTLPALDKTIEGTAKTTLWDPMIGVDWQTGGERWKFDASFEGGGFGVGTDVDLSADARIRRRFAGHLEIRAGYTVVHFKETLGSVTIGALQRTLAVKQTLHGPEIGFGIVF